MPDIPSARLEGGLWCPEVLERLDAYVADELADTDRVAVDTHLRACRQCERFGGTYGGLVKALRRGLVASLDEDRGQRLETQLKRMLEDG